MKIHCGEYYNSLEDYPPSGGTIKDGYFFSSDYIFEEFVDTLYNMRKSYPKDNPMNHICKLIMNSLYGRFRLRPINNKQSFVSRADFIDLTEKSSIEIENILDLDAPPTPACRRRGGGILPNLYWYPEGD
uniref:DNA polymerase n=1 Tax=Dichomitus squalens TaxID=114155 RepID=UPI0030023F60|nr:DNA polymerase [Dichomitus squalens]